MFEQFITRRSSVSVLLFFFISLLISAIVIVCMDAYVTRSSSVSMTSSLPSPKLEYKLNCSNGDVKRTCPINYPLTFELNQSLAMCMCPEYFWWIHEDLRPWKQTGISREMLERGGGVAHFKLVIVDGKVYVKKYKKPFQTRDVFTIWGVVQLTRLYPGLIPDLELVFYCDDRPVINKHDYTAPNATSPPPVFHYCANDESLDIVFPDWTFWGWAETNVRPWESLLKDIKQGSKKIKWEDRVPYAFWKGNARVGGRVDLMKCNVSDKHDWNGRFYQQDWIKESKEGFKNSRLEDQCTHRYKVYVEGQGWSVSEKYILACDSMTLLVKPRYYDFFIRSMRPMQHYWPIRTTNKCRDIKFAVEWGNNHPEQAQAIGKAGSRYMRKNLSMVNVYDYTFHLLREYSKLLRFKPSIPVGAEEVCSETMACSQVGLWQKFMKESMVKSPSDTPPCSMPPSYEPKDLQAFLGEKERIMKRVEMWESEYWESSNRKQEIQ